jgi:hypothetical protein
MDHTNCMHYAGRILRLCALVLLVSLPSSSVSAATALTSPYFLVSDYDWGRIQRFDAATGAFIDTFATGITPAGELARGPDGNIYVSSFTDNKIFKINGVNGAPMGAFISGGALVAPRGIAFGSDGNLYVAKTYNQTGASAVQRYDGATGAYLGDFTPSTTTETPIGIAFGPDGDLYVATYDRTVARVDTVKRYNGQTGAFLSTVATLGNQIPQHIAFAPNGDMFVSNQWSATIAHYSGSTFLGSFAANTNNPQGLTFLPGGDLAVASFKTTIRRFDPETHVYVGDVISGNVFQAADVLYVPEPLAIPVVVPLVMLLMRRRRPMAPTAC